MREMLASVLRFLGGLLATRRRAAAGAGVVALAGISVYIGSSTIPGGATNVANLWVDADGGTCTRQATAGEYVDAAACTPADLDTAYAAASCGDTVRIKAQSLPDQTLTAAAKSCTAETPVTFRPAEGETVTFADDLEIDGPTYMTFQDMATTTPGTGGVEDGTFCAGVTVSPSILRVSTDPGVGAVDSHHIVFDNLDGFRRVQFYGYVEDLTVRNSTFGPGCDAQPQLNTASGGADAVERPRRVVIEDNTFHDYARSEDLSHTECFQILRADNVTFRRNKLYDCDGTGALGVTDGPHVDLLIENNWFQVGAGDAVRACQITGNQTGGTGLIVRYNSADGGCGWSNTTVPSAARFEGNYMPYNAGFCRDSTWVDNVLEGGTCDASDTNTASLVFADAANNDMHLTASSTDALGAVATCGVATDIDGDSRPASDCDAGADER